MILPAFGVTIHDFEALRAHRLHPRGHDVRLGAQRLEARRELRARRLHRADPRQALPRGDARDGVAGAEVRRRATTSSCATWTRRGSSAITSRAAPSGDDADGDARARRVSRLRSRRCISQRIGVANQTTMLARESLAIGEEVGEAIARARGADARATRLPHLRHDLQRDAGASGRRDRAAAGAARRDGRDRRIQLEQHDLARGALRRAGADVSRRVARRDRPGDRRGAPPAARAQAPRSGHRSDWLPPAPSRSGSPRARARRTTRSARRWCASSRRADWICQTS